MIQLGEISLNLSDPLVLAALIFGAFLILILSLVIATNRSATRSARMAEPMIAQMNDLATRVQGLSDGQHQLTGGLTHVSEAQAQSQTSMLQLMERRLAQVQEQMNENLHGSARRTAHSLGELQQRLTAIDKEFGITDALMEILAAIAFREFGVPRG